MQAEHFLYFNNRKIKGEDLEPVNAFKPLPQVAKAAVRS